ncbi:hypothetical protein ACLB2K_073485 [Fragaria x ananassa]
MAETIGDEICSERPIYVRAACSGKYKPENLWYVIEEKPRNRCDDTEGLLCYSDSDYIRRISVPDSDVQDTSLAVLGSRIYLIGGDIDTAMKNEDKENIGYKHFELGQNPEWVLGGGKLLSAQFGAAAVGRDGFIYSVGCNQYQLSPDTGILKQLPQFPVPASLTCLMRREINSYESHLLALTKSTLFIYVTVSLNAPNLMFSYDLGTGEWDEGYDNISGTWSAGVVLYDDRYLFAFGTQNPMSLPATMSMKPVQVVVPGIYVFDIQQRKWLPEPVKGLPTDGITLPEVYETHDYESEADMYDDGSGSEAGPGYTPYLFQVEKENDHKLALLWDTERPNPESGHCLMDLLFLMRGPSNCLIAQQEYFKNLQSLEICGGELTDAGVKNLKDLVCLTWLNLSQNRSLTDKSLEVISGLTALVSSNITNSRIIDEGFII